jgi:transcriptional regulator with XRE-family HTH domain
MSSLAGIGSRLHQMRTELGYSQSKIAAALSISDRSYKNYEADKTDLPLATALNFCKIFSVDLNWLIQGRASLTQEKAGQIFEDCTYEILRELERRRITIPSIDVSTYRIAKACAYLANQCIEKGTKPSDEASAVMDLIL